MLCSALYKKLGTSSENLYCPPIFNSFSATTQKMEFSIKNVFDQCDQMRNFLRIWSHLLKKPLMENFIFWAICTTGHLIKEVAYSRRLSCSLRKMKFEVQFFFFLFRCVCWCYMVHWTKFMHYRKVKLFLFLIILVYEYI